MDTQLDLKRLEWEASRQHLEASRSALSNARKQFEVASQSTDTRSSELTRSIAVLDAASEAAGDAQEREFHAHEAFLEADAEERQLSIWSIVA